MDEEDLLPRKQKPAPKPLDTLGVAELEQYVADLEAEIRRARAVIASKQVPRRCPTKALPTAFSGSDTACERNPVRGSQAL